MGEGLKRAFAAAKATRALEKRKVRTVMVQLEMESSASLSMLNEKECWRVMVGTYFKDNGTRIRQVRATVAQPVKEPKAKKTRRPREVELV